MSTLKRADKIRLLVELIELGVRCGYDISDWVGKPLSFFDFDGVAELIKKFQTELDNQ